MIVLLKNVRMQEQKLLWKWEVLWKTRSLRVNLHGLENHEYGSTNGKHGTAEKGWHPTANIVNYEACDTWWHLQNTKDHQRAPKGKNPVWHKRHGFTGKVQSNLQATSKSHTTTSYWRFLGIGKSIKICTKNCINATLSKFEIMWTVQASFAAELVSGPSPKRQKNPATCLAVALLWVIAGLQTLPEPWTLELPILQGQRADPTPNQRIPNGLKHDMGNPPLLQVYWFLAKNRAWTRVTWRQYKAGSMLNPKDWQTRTLLK